MNPFFFGSSDKQLFGIHHEPEREEVRDGAVLLCPSFGHEYIAAHGSLQQLACQLARQGFHVLRFDYYGCGDSAGDVGDASFEQWIDDVGMAMEELRESSGSRRVCVVGIRMGAVLAAVAGARARVANQESVFASVLWEPPVCGEDYLRELAQIHRRWMGAMYLRPPRHIDGADGPEVMGFGIPQSIQDELRAIDLLDLPARPAERILIMQNSEGERLADLHRRLASAGNGVAHDVFPSSEAWIGGHWGTVALAPVDVLRRIAQWIAEVYQ